VNWINGQPLVAATDLQIKIRYRANPVPGTVTDLGSGSAFVKFKEAISGSTPGQGAVFYDDDVCLGGGLIADDLAPQPDTGLLLEDKLQ
jgi:tRNA-specific 2-thiouridylase